jgi:uncharacterized tellurite resistance protein B-like protein
MAWIDWIRRKAAEPAGTGDTDTVRRIVRELDRLDPLRARHLAAFAYVLSRVASADLHISEAETDKIVEIVTRVGHLPEEQAVLVVEIAKNQNRMFGGTENFLVTREFRDLASDAQRAELLDCLFAVSAADDAITGEEEQHVWQIASELGFSHPEYIAARLAYSDKRTVLKKSKGRLSSEPEAS